MWQCRGNPTCVLWSSFTSPHLCHSLCELLQHLEDIIQAPYSRVSTIDTESGQRMGRRQQGFVSRLSGWQGRCFLLHSHFPASTILAWQKLPRLLHSNHCFSKHSVLCTLCSHLSGNKVSLVRNPWARGWLSLGTIPGINGCPHGQPSCICCHIRSKAKVFAATHQQEHKCDIG